MDHNTQVQFSADGHPMGSAWTSGEGVRFAVNVIDPDPTDAVTEIDLMRGITGVSNAVVVATNVGSPTFAWRERQTFAAGTEAHYYVRIKMADNANVWTGPVYVKYDPAAVTGVDDGRGASARFALATSPNPMFGRVAASFTLSNATDFADLSVYDAAGRRVTTLIQGPLAAGSHRIEWTGVDEANRPVKSGIFFLRFKSGVHSATSKVLLIR